LKNEETNTDADEIKLTRTVDDGGECGHVRRDAKQRHLVEPGQAIIGLSHLHKHV
jgi:hypothetical protein